jgi:hypothetical protein
MQLEKLDCVERRVRKRTGRQQAPVQTGRSRILQLLIDVMHVVSFFHRRSRMFLMFVWKYLVAEAGIRK